MNALFQSQYQRIAAKYATKFWRKQGTPSPPTGANTVRQGQVTCNTAEVGRGKIRDVQSIEEMIAELKRECERKDCCLKLMSKGILVSARDPTEQDIHEARVALHIESHALHIGVTGGAGCGKTDLIRAFTNNSDPIYSNCYRSDDVLWYDLPEVGTETCDRNDFYWTQKFYAFDLIINVVDQRIVDSDISVAFMCQRWNIPYIFVRTRSDQMRRDVYDDLRDQGVTGEELLVSTEKLMQQKVSAIKRNFYDNLMQADFHEEVAQAQMSHFFIISCRTLKGRICGDSGKTKDGTVDEDRLLRFMERLSKHKKEGIEKPRIR